MPSAVYYVKTNNGLQKKRTRKIRENNIGERVQKAFENAKKKNQPFSIEASYDKPPMKLTWVEKKSRMNRDMSVRKSRPRKNKSNNSRK